MILITGTCGFIGYHLSRLLSISNDVVGIDNFNDYYDVSLKKNRRDLLDIPIYRCDILDKGMLENIFEMYRPEVVIHLAAYAGVRYSMDHSGIYLMNNVIGFRNILECCEKYRSKLIYASSSSVYGDGDVPYKESYKPDPQSPYAVTKYINELDARMYSTKYGVPTIGLRFFSVYGEYGRPDMAYFKFTNSLISGSVINLYNYGDNLRDFTYVGDIVNAIERIISYNASCDVFNLGNNHPVSTKDLINIIINSMNRHGLNIVPHVNYLGPLPGEAITTYSDTSKFESIFGGLNHTDIADGIDRFIKWYLYYY